MTETLKPCAHCGGEGILRSLELPMLADCGDVFVKCIDCDAQGPSILFDQDTHTSDDLPGIENEATDLWNTRSTPAPTETLKPVAWMYDYPGNDDPRFQTYEGMSCNEEDAGMIETPLYAHPPVPLADEALVEAVAKAICHQAGSICRGFCHSKRCEVAIRNHSADARAALTVAIPAIRAGIADNVAWRHGHDWCGEEVAQKIREGKL